MAENLGNAVLELRTDASKFTSGIKGAQTQAKGLSGTFSKLSKFKLPALAVAGAIAGLAVMAKKAIDAADVMDKLALKTGFSVEALGALKLQAELGGTNLGTMEKAVKRMQSSLVDAEQGMASATDALGLMGLSIDDLKGKTPEEQFITLAKALNDIEDPTIKAAAAQDVFGRAGVELIPTLGNLAKGMEFIKEEAGKLGPVLTTEGAKGAADFNDALTELGTVFKSAGAAFLNSGVLEFFTNVVKGIVNLIGSFGNVRESLGGLGIDWDAIWGRISDSFKTRLEAISGLVTSFLAFFVTAWDTNFGGIKTTAEVVWGLILSIIDGAMVAIDAVFSGTLGAIAGIFDIFTAALTGNWSALWDGIKTVFSGVWEAMLGIIDGAIIAISGALASFFNALGATDIAGFFSDVESSIKDAREETGKFEDSTDDAIKPVKSLADALKDADKKAGSKGFAGAMKKAKEEIDRFDLSKAITAAKALEDQIRDLTIEAIQKLIDLPLPDLTAGLKDMAEKAIDSTADLLKLAGGVNDLKNPMTTAMGKTAALEGALDALGIKSDAIQKKELSDLAAAVETVRQAMFDGTATARDLQAAEEAYAKALGKQGGVTDSTDDFTTAIGNTLDKLNDLGSNIGNALVSGQPLDALKNMFGDLKTIAGEFANIALQAVKDQLLGLQSFDFAGLKDKLAGLFGGGGGGAAGAASAAGGASGAVSGAASGAFSMINMITGFAQLGAQIFALFQNSRMVGTLGDIEEQSRRTAQFLGDRSDQGILGALFKINEEIAFGTTNKAVLLMKDKIVAHLPAIEQFLNSIASTLKSGVAVAISNVVAIADAVGGAVADATEPIAAAVRRLPGRSRTAQMPLPEPERRVPGRSRSAQEPPPRRVPGRSRSAGQEVEREPVPRRAPGRSRSGPPLDDVERAIERTAEAAEEQARTAEEQAGKQIIVTERVVAGTADICACLVRLGQGMSQQLRSLGAGVGIGPIIGTFAELAERGLFTSNRGITRPDQAEGLASFFEIDFQPVIDAVSAMRDQLGQRLEQMNDAIKLSVAELGSIRLLGENGNQTLSFINPSLDTIKGSLFTIAPATERITPAIKELTNAIKNAKPPVVSVTVNVDESGKSVVKTVIKGLKLNTGGLRTAVAAAV